MRVPNAVAEKYTDEIYDYWLEHYHRPCNTCGDDHEPEDCGYELSNIEKLESPHIEDYPFLDCEPDYDAMLKDDIC